MNSSKIQIDNIPLFYPDVNQQMKQAVITALNQQMIGQGQIVDQFEEQLCQKLNTKHLITVNCGTSALEIAYQLLDLKSGDEVISPVLTCTATNLPLVRRGIKIIFADIQENLLIDWEDVKRKISPKTKAIINVHLFNQISQTPKLPVPIIGDAAQYLGHTENEVFTAYSFQATKIITTVDGGALACKYQKDYKRAKLLRWYGINRENGQDHIDVDIFEAGYKYHMNNITAAMGIAALAKLDSKKQHIKSLQKIYFDILKDLSEIKLIGGSPFLIHAQNRQSLIQSLNQQGIEAGLVHKRNDLYTVFGSKRQLLPNMNKYENSYLLLPCRANINKGQVEYIASQIRRFYGNKKT